MKRTIVVRVVEKVRRYLDNLIYLRLYDLLLIGLFIRLFLAPFSEYPYDVETMKQIGVITFKLGVYPFQYFTFYGFMWWYTLLAIYPFYLLVSPFCQSMLLETLFLKIPLIIGDIAIAFLIFSFVKQLSGDNRKAKVAFILWFFNPYVIWMNDVHGMFDVLPALFTLISLALLVKRRWTLSGLSLAVAVFYKIYPIVLLPLYIMPVFKEKGFKCTLRFLIGFVVSSLVINIPNLISSQILATSWQLGPATLAAGGGSITPLSYIWFLVNSGLIKNLPSSLPLLFTLPCYVLLVFYLGLKKRMDHIDVLTLSQNISLVIFVLFLTYTRLDPQFFNWIFPYLILLASLKRFPSRIVHFFWITLVFFLISHAPIDYYFISTSFPYSPDQVLIPKPYIPYWKPYSAHILLIGLPFIGLAFSILCFISIVILVSQIKMSVRATDKAGYLLKEERQ